MKLNDIIFYFGNGECIVIDGKYIGHFLVDDIRQTIARSESNSVDVVETAHQFAIEIHKDANEPVVDIEDEDAEPVNSFDRLLENDLAMVEFTLEDEEKNQYDFELYVPWSEKDEYTNKNQQTLISQWGHLYISVDDTGDKSIRFKQSDIDEKGANQELNSCVKENKKGLKDE